VVAVATEVGPARLAAPIDTGLYGTTRQLLAEGLPAVDFGSALIAHSYRPGPQQAKTFGLSVIPRRPGVGPAAWAGPDRRARRSIEGCDEC
jgi:hypothetical protein